MPFNTTVKHALRWLTGTSLVSDIDAGFQALAEDVDSKLTPYAAGLHAARPVSTPANPGKSGRLWRSTDTGRIFLDHGTGWEELTIPEAVRGEENLRIIRGTIWTDGSITSGAGFTVTKGTTGIYTINFNAPFPANPSATANPGPGATGYMVSTWALSTTSVTFDLRNYDNTFTNRPFNFIVVGPR